MAEVVREVSAGTLEKRKQAQEQNPVCVSLVSFFCLSCGAVLCFICLKGLVDLHAKADGVCTAAREGNNVKCLGGRVKNGFIYKATITLHTGEAQTCNGFHLSGTCGDEEGVFNGEARACNINDDGLCAEPGTDMFPIIALILALVCTGCCSFCCCLSMIASLRELVMPKQKRSLDETTDTVEAQNGAETLEAPQQEKSGAPQPV